MEFKCRHFSGYKPCALNNQCDSSCPTREVVDQRILFVHLGALGAVVRSTALLSEMKKRHPHSHLTWVTDKPADQILRGHPLVDLVLTTDFSDYYKMNSVEYDLAYVIDKSVAAAGLVKSLKVKKILGFTTDNVSGAIVPANREAQELWEIGLNDNRKFFINKKTELQLIAEALGFSYRSKDFEYNLPLNESEKKLRFERRKRWSQEGKKFIVGINTGCSQHIPAKKLSFESHAELISDLKLNETIQIVLLGGKEDFSRNQELSRAFSILESPTDLGLRDGLVSVSACDVVITGDSLGMHMALSQKVYCIAWFGPTCAHEIEFFKRGEAILSQAPCGPCWKRSCQKPVMCYDQVDLKKIVNAVERRLLPCPPQQQIPNITL